MKKNYIYPTIETIVLTEKEDIITTSGTDDIMADPYSILTL